MPIPPPALPPETGLWRLGGGGGMPARLAEMLAATRLLLGAWDATLLHWPPQVPALAARTTEPAQAQQGVGHTVTPPVSEAAQETEEALAWAASLTHAVPVVDQNQTTPSLSVQVLDGLQIWLGQEQVIAPVRGKSRALLVYLLLHRRRPVPRSRLCSLFWPESDPASARNNLHVNLHRLRRHFAQAHPATAPALDNTPWLQHGPEGYQLVTQGELWLDAEHFGFHARLGEHADQTGDVASALRHYELAAALYRSDLVEESEREPVLRALSQGLRDQLNLVLERLSALREAHGQVHACLRAAQRHLALDDCNEATHRRLMRCYALLGQPRLAEQQYRTCVQTLAQRLGLPPTDETRALFREISERRANG